MFMILMELFLRKFLHIARTLFLVYLSKYLKFLFLLVFIGLETIRLRAFFVCFSTILSANGFLFCGYFLMILGPIIFQKKTYFSCSKWSFISSFKMNFASQAEVPDRSKYVQTVPGGKYLCPDRPRWKVPMSRLSCVHRTFVRSCPDFRAFTGLSCVHVQTFVRSPDFRAFTRLSWVHVQIFVRFLMFSDYVILTHDAALVRSSLVCTYLLPSGTSTWVTLVEKDKVNWIYATLTEGYLSTANKNNSRDTISSESKMTDISAISKETEISLFRLFFPLVF